MGTILGFLNVDAMGRVFSRIESNEVDLVLRVCIACGDGPLRLLLCHMNYGCTYHNHSVMHFGTAELSGNPPILLDLICGLAMIPRAVTNQRMITHYCGQP
jgi:hypothetical protein